MSRQVILIEYSSIGKNPLRAYQDIFNGVVQRYADADGNTIVLPDRCESIVVDADPPQPTWLVPEPDPLVVPDPGPIPEIISDRQFFEALAVAGIVTEDEALAAVQTGTLPSKLLALIAMLPANQQFAAKMMLCGSVEFHRSHHLVDAISQGYNQMAAAQGWPILDPDAIFRLAGTL